MPIHRVPNVVGCLYLKSTILTKVFYQWIGGILGSTYLSLLVWRFIWFLAESIDDETYNLNNVPGSNNYILFWDRWISIISSVWKTKHDNPRHATPQKEATKPTSYFPLKYWYLYIKYQDVTYFELFKKYYTTFAKHNSRNITKFAKKI